MLPRSLTFSAGRNLVSIGGQIDESCSEVHNILLLYDIEPKVSLRLHGYRHWEEKSYFECPEARDLRIEYRWLGLKEQNLLPIDWITVSPIPQGTLSPMETGFGQSGNRQEYDLPIPAVATARLQQIVAAKIDRGELEAAARLIVNGVRAGHDLESFLDSAKSLFQQFRGAGRTFHEGHTHLFDLMILLQASPR